MTRKPDLYIQTFEILLLYRETNLSYSGSQSHAFSCKHEMHDLLTLVY